MAPSLTPGLRIKQFITWTTILGITAVVFTAIEARGTQEDLVVTVADGGIQSFAESGLQTTATLVVENFDDRPHRSTTGFTSTAGTFAGSFTIFDANPFGGAGGSGRHPTATNMLMDMPTTSDYEYVGFWWSAGNADNHVDLLDIDDNTLATFTVDIANSTEDLAGVVGTCGVDPPTNDYCGNPNLTITGPAWGAESPWVSTTRIIAGEPYAFVHLRYEPGFRKVRFRGAGFEIDNITVSQTAPPLASTETTTETFNPYSISTPSVIIADPRATSVTFPGLELGEGADETQALLCFAEVAQGGGALSGTPSISFSGSGTGITSTSDTNLAAFSGARATVISFAPSVAFASSASGQSFGVGSLYVRVSASPQTNLGTNGCTGNNARSVVVELRMLPLLSSNSVGIRID